MKKKVAKKKRPASKRRAAAPAAYSDLLGGVGDLLECARRASARTVNALITPTYWEIGRRIVEHEQHGKRRAGYGKELLRRLAADLTSRFGRGFSVDNLENMRRFYGVWDAQRMSETLSRNSGMLAEVYVARKKSETLSRIFVPALPGLSNSRVVA